MRKLLMVVTMLLVPALANAWVLAVKVTNTSAGIAAGNKATGTVGATSTDVTAGTKYFYPTNSPLQTVTVVVANPTNATVTLGGIAATPDVSTTDTYTIVANAGKTLQTLGVVYGTAPAAVKQNINLTSTAGGVSAIKIGAALNSAGFTNVAPGTVFDVVAQPNVGFKVSSITIEGGANLVAVPSTSKVTLTAVTVSGESTDVDVQYSVDPQITLVLAAPPSAVSGTAINAIAQASSNVAGVTYKFATTCQSGVDQAAFQGSNLFSFTPDGVSASCTVSVQATVAGLAVPASKSMTIAVTNGALAGAQICTACHASSTPAIVAAFTAGTHFNNGVGTGTVTCASCHTTSAHTPGPTCLGCHSVALNAGDGYVQDNNGVRSITQEFTKWSHHVTGVTLQNAHCAACHLEGTVVAGEIHVDATYHMADAQVHLRNADTDADMAWNPAAPNHSTMDTFCMSCHDANGATSAGSAAIQAVVIPAAGKTASASNPFGDTISNRYDKMQRPAVVNVDSQFNTGNASHHAVKGPKYSGRTRAAGPRQITNAAAFASNSTASLWGTRSTIYDSVNSLTGAQETSNLAFNALYVPLENASGETAPRTGSADLGDDSTLHCGDCHTVGQWKVGSSVNAAGQPTPVAIGAHGSSNEYLLRNSTGTDERHTQDAYVTVSGVTTITNPNAAFLVCYNCHSYSRYGSVYGATGATGPHAGEYDANGRCNGVGNTIAFNGYTTGTATDGTQFESRLGTYGLPTVAAYASGFPLNEANRPASGEQAADFGNVLGIQCLNCHNSGVDAGYGGIHGSAVSTYTDGMGNTNTKRRFLPGLGNAMHVPGTLGGFTGGTTAGPITNTQVYTYITGGVSKDANWEQVAWKQDATGAASNTYAGAGCYTLYSADVAPNAPTVGLKGMSVDGGATIPDAIGTWGGCEDHSKAQGAGDHGFIKRITRPVTY